MIPIATLTLKNFKTYKYQSFSLSNLTVFCGSNSVGKSTAIQAIGMFLQSDFSRREVIKINGELAHIGNVNDLHNFANRDEDELFIEIGSPYFDGKWGYKDPENEERDTLVERNELQFIGANEALLKIGEFLKGDFRYQYLEAERYGPRDNLPLAQHNHHHDWLGTKGEYTIEVLESLVTKRRVELSSRNVGNKDPRKHPAIANNYAFQNIGAWMEEVSLGHKLNPQKEARANTAFNSIIPTTHNQETKPINIGFGYSYALSIVTALVLATPGSMVIVENPEAHLHPRGQSYLGRLIALTAQAGVQVIIETHSDHLLNGMRVITRTHDDFDPSIFTLYYISQDEEDCHAEKILLDKEGKLSSWPKGFFDQQAQDMFTIMTGKTELPSSKRD